MTQNNWQYKVKFMPNEDVVWDFTICCPVEIVTIVSERRIAVEQ
jgi:hypothetical protein